MMHGDEKSDSAIVARNPANNAGRPAAEQGYRIWRPAWVSRRRRKLSSQPARLSLLFIDALEPSSLARLMCHTAQ